MCRTGVDVKKAVGMHRRAIKDAYYVGCAGFLFFAILSHKLIPVPGGSVMSRFAVILKNVKMQKAQAKLAIPYNRVHQLPPLE